MPTRMAISYEEMIRQLQDIFPNKSLSTIQYVVDIINTENPLERDDYKFESAINLLTETGNGSDEFIELHNEAVGGEGAFSNEIDISGYIENLIQIFPDCQISHMENLLRNRGSNLNFDDVVDQLSLSKKRRCVVSYLLYMYISFYR